MQDINHILKRLEIIKGFIQLEETDAILSQTERLKQFELNADLRRIVNNITAGSYLESIEQINTFLTQYHSVTLYTDIEVSGLKLEINALEAELNALEF